MRTFLAFILITALIALTACSRGSEINGHSLKTAMKSVRYMKERLPPEKRIEFEVSFWTLHDAIKDTDDFLDEVDGKNPDQIISEGKRIYEERKKAGIAEYTKYATWEEMISQFQHEKSEQGTKKKDPKDRQPTVLYKL